MGILFEIEFDNSSKLFYAGQSVVGRIVIESDKETRINELLLRSTGKAEVSWTESSGSKRSTTPDVEGKTGGKLFSDEETYFDRRITLLEKVGPEDIIAEAGRNEYGFTFNLPVAIPSSYDGTMGHIHYFVEALIKRPNKTNTTVKKQIYVHGIVDLNLIPEAAGPMEAADEKQLCCCFCKSGPIGFHMKVDKCGVVAGEAYNFVAEVYNMSNTRQVAIVIRLIQETIFHAKTVKKCVTTEILNKKGPVVSAGGLERWADDPVQIPTGLPPTKLAGCRIIDVNYILKVELDVQRGVDLNAQIPIIIGTIPLGTRSEDVYLRRPT